jgi:hypothetical protein
VCDGRDVAVSAKSSIFNNFHVYYSALRWQREQRLGLEWLATLPPEQILLLKYEDLISNVEATVRKLCVFLGEPFEEQMLAYHLSGEARKSGALSVSWENTAKPVIRDNANKYRSQLTQKEIMQFEAIAHEEMQELSYRLDNPLELLLQKQSELTVEHFSYRLSELQLKMKAEIHHLIKDKNSAARLRKNLYMSYIRLLRRMSTPNV